MLKVLIICNDFPPLNSIGARRPYSWLKYFNQYDIEPIVITKWWPKKAESLDDVMRQVETEQFHNNIIETDQYGTVIRVHNKLAVYDKLYLHRKGLIWTIIRKCVTMIWRFLSFIIPYFDNHWNLYLEAKHYVMDNHVDAVITTGEPFILFRYGYLLKKKFNIKWIADYRDGWFLHQGTRFSRNPLVWFWRHWERIFEKKYVPHANIITAAFPILCEELKIFFGKTIYLLINGYEELVTKMSETKNGTSLVLTLGGNVTIGQKHDLFLEAIYQLKKEELINANDILIQFIGGAYDPRQKALLFPYTTLLSDVLITTQRVTIEEARQMCANSDYLLLFLIPNYKHIPSKLFDYLSLQRPILVIPNDNDVVYKIVTDTNSGLFLSDIDSIKKFILAQIDFKKKGNSIQSINLSNEAIFKYSRQYQTKLLADIIKTHA